MAEEQTRDSHRVLVLTKTGEISGTSPITIKGVGGATGQEVEVSGGAIAINMSVVQYVSWEKDHYHIAHGLL